MLYCKALTENIYLSRKLRGSCYHTNPMKHRTVNDFSYFVRMLAGQQFFLIKKVIGLRYLCARFY
jgi:hypothetical protein